MSRDLSNRYFTWLTSKIKNQDMKHHTQLLNHLSRINFGYLMERDDNRFYDGIELRYHFGDEEGIHQAQIATELDVKPCSMLEMMVALSIRLENIMSNDKYGDRVPTWFWTMIKNMVLYQFTDAVYNIDRVEMIIDKFINRDYQPNGKGGLFITDRKNIDMRGTEIWYQAMIFLEDETEKEK